jgi:hypothetical protein
MEARESKPSGDACGLTVPTLTFPKQRPSRPPTFGWLPVTMARTTRNSAADPDEPSNPRNTGKPGAPGDSGEPTTPESANPETLVLPTEQLETTPSPVSASAAASGGATGLSDEPGASATSARPAGRDSVFRRHPVATGIVAGAIAVVIACGLTAWGVGTAVTASLTNQSAPIAAPSTSTATPAPDAGGIQGGRLAPGRIAFRATIQSIDDSTWTILTKRGQTVNLTITSSTQFGTKRISETKGSFTVGESVAIVATRINGTATAVRVVDAADLGAGSGDGSDGQGTDGDQPTPTPSPTPTATT